MNITISSYFNSKPKSTSNRRINICSQQISSIILFPFCREKEINGTRLISTNQTNFMNTKSKMDAFSNLHNKHNSYTNLRNEMTFRDFHEDQGDFRWRYQWYPFKSDFMLQKTDRHTSFSVSHKWGWDEINRKIDIINRFFRKRDTINDVELTKWANGPLQTFWLYAYYATDQRLDSILKMQKLMKYERRRKEIMSCCWYLFQKASPACIFQ